MKVLGVIPARWASTRLPGKPLKEIDGKAMIHWVWDQAMKATSISEVVVATDDKRIAEYCGHHDLNFVMTSPSHPTGSDRLAEVADKISADIYVNVQGDEPLIDVRLLKKICSILCYQ